MNQELKDNAIMKYFEYAHLPEHLQKVSKPFGELANQLCEILACNAEGETALRKLLEAKDCAVRSALSNWLSLIPWIGVVDVVL